MKTDEDFKNKNNNKTNESVLDGITKQDNRLQRLFNMINKYNAETIQYVTFCDNVNSNIKKDFAKIREIVNDKINFILKEYSQTNDKLENEQVSLKREIDFLQKENEELLVKIVDLKQKITKMEKIIGHKLKDQNGRPFKTK